MFLTFFLSPINLRHTNAPLLGKRPVCLEQIVKKKLIKTNGHQREQPNLRKTKCKSYLRYIL